jgi:hypothetical protein
MLWHNVDIGDGASEPCGMHKYKFCASYLAHSLSLCYLCVSYNKYQAQIYLNHFLLNLPFFSRMPTIKMLWHYVIP